MKLSFGIPALSPRAALQGRGQLLWSMPATPRLDAICKLRGVVLGKRRAEWRFAAQ